MRLVSPGPQNASLLRLEPINGCIVSNWGSDTSRKPKSACRRRRLLARRSWRRARAPPRRPLHSNRCPVRTALSKIGHRIDPTHSSKPLPFVMIPVSMRASMPCIERRWDVMRGGARCADRAEQLCSAPTLPSPPSSPQARREIAFQAFHHTNRPWNTKFATLVVFIGLNPTQDCRFLGLAYTTAAHRLAAN